MGNTILTKKYMIHDDLNQEIAFVTLEHLWADVFALKYKRILNNPTPTPTQWSNAFKEALLEVNTLKVRQVLIRLIKDDFSENISLLLPELGFNKKNERVEFKKLVCELPDDSGTPMIWKTALEMGLSPNDVAKILKMVSVGDPDSDPNEDPMLFIQDFLADPVLTSGLQCIHIGFIENKIVALTVIQINPKNGWSRISYMGVGPEFRGKKLGQWVHRHSFKIMKQEGGVQYHGGTASTNTKMIRLFETHNCNRFCEMEEWQVNMKGGI
jgi:hypothetical protein